MVIVGFTRGKRDGQMFPVNQVAAGGMAPVHTAPHGGIGVVLVKQVILVVVVNAAVGVVEPPARRHEVIFLPPTAGFGRYSGCALGGLGLGKAFPVCHILSRLFQNFIPRREALHTQKRTALPYIPLPVPAWLRFGYNPHHLGR